MTSEERKLWFEFLRGLPVKVTRQRMIGKYIVDFYCAKEKVVIEIDGSQHYDEEGKATDEERDRYLFSMGIRVVRVSNREVNTNFCGVCDSLYQLLVKQS
jgi:very-short-patch-repair endonuclease